MSTSRAELFQKLLRKRQINVPQAEAIPRRTGEGPWPLSFAQQRLWVMNELAVDGGAYNIPLVLHFHGDMDVGALRRAVEALVARHESLRTRFVTLPDGSPVQVIDPPGRVDVPVVDLGAVDEPRRAALADRLAREEAALPFDLERGRPLRVTVLRLGPAELALFFTVHHIVSDGWSMGVVARELSHLYGAYSRGEPPALPELPIQCADYAVWQREHLAGGRLEAQLEYWTGWLAGAPPLLELPTDRPRHGSTDAHGEACVFRLPDEDAERLRELARREGVTLFMTLLAAFQAVLARWSGQSDVLVGVPIAGRPRLETERLIGFFVNVLVLRGDLSGDPTFRELLARTRETTLGAYANQDLPFERLVEELKVERSLHHTPVFQVVFNLMTGDEEDRVQGMGDVRVERHAVGTGTAKFDLSLQVTDAGGALSAGLAYRTWLFDEATIGRMMNHLWRVLQAVSADPGRRLSELALLDLDERRRVLEEWNATDGEVPADACVHEAFARAAAATPGAAAVVCGAESLTYAELDARANRLAHHLRALGVGPEVRVAVLLERSVEMVAAILAVLKAGGAYVPFDPAWPGERVRLILDDARARVLVTRGEAPGGIAASGASLIRLDVDHDAARWPAHAPESGVRAENLAYVIFTSGSTGRPRGVGVEHRSVLNLYAALRRSVYAARGAAPPPRVSVNGSVSFDTSVKQLVQLLGGATLCVIPEEARYDAAALAGYLDAHGVEVLDCTPAQLRPLLAEGFLERAGASLTDLLVAGEAIDAGLWAELAALERPRAWNLYGPTECTVDAALTRVHGPRPVLGRPVLNARTYVLDEGLAPAPVGVPGELFVGGAGVARGYLERPGATAARFVPDSFSGRPGARMYRTGDRARWLPEGELEYLGRTDLQVKVRGYRVEPGEVEGVLAAHSSVRQAVVAARDDAPGGTRLVAYVVPEEGADVSAAELRAEARRLLPEHMAPSAVVVLDALPLTPNGKVDRRALPAPEQAGEEDSFAAPRTPMEEILAGIWAEVLGLERVGVDQDFFDLGGHSLLAMRITARVRAALGVELPLRALFEQPTVAVIARLLQERTRDAAGAAAPPLVPVPRDRPLPLSFAQRRLWFIDQLEPGSAVYNIPLALRLRGELDAQALEHALTGVVRRHESLRTTFAVAGDEPVQMIGEPARISIPVTDLRGMGEAEREARVRRAADEEMARPFDLARGPLLRASLLRLGDAEWALLFTMHHVVSDGWSLGILVREVAALYDAYLEGRPAALAPLPVQYADYAAWQRGWLAGEVLDQELAYWRGALAGAPPLIEIPTDRPRPPVQGDGAAHAAFSLSAETAGRLRALSRREGATLFMTVLAGWQLLLARWSGQAGVSVGTAVAGRTHPSTEGLIGFFVNTLVLHTDLSGATTFGDLVWRVREVTLGAYAHQELPFERLVEEVAPERSLSYAPLFQAAFALRPHERGAAPIGKLRVDFLERGELPAKFDLNLGMVDDGDALHGTLAWRAELWDAGTIERMAGHLAALLERVAEDPERPLDEVSLLGDSERRRVLEEWNATGRGYPAGLHVHGLFAAQAARTPHAVAVVHGGKTLAYAELDRRANRLANRLRALGVCPESRVGVCMTRTPELLVALLGILKAGGAYVPLDPAYPQERLGYMIADGGVRLVVTESQLADRLPGGADLLVVDLEAESLSREAETAPESGATPENLSHVIFTSGSTGRPKGVMIRHSSTVVLLHWMRENVTDEERASVLFSTSINFDVSVAEIFGTLCWGGRLVLVENALELATVREEIVYASMVPSAAAELLRMGAIPSSVRTLNLGGEALPNDLAQGLYALGTVEKVGNLYGPTEDTTYSTYSVVERGGSRVTVGRLVAGTRAYVLDAHLQPVPIGVTGELYLSGDGLARGYASAPGMTAERFVPNPFGAPGSRMYRVMDRVRWLADGELEYLGRIDHQVKVRGFRIEPGEIETVLRAHPGVREAVAVVREDAPGDRRLAAYVVADEGASLSAAELRAEVKRRLPEYMVPSAFVVLGALPLTPNGKVDRRALPVPELATEAEGHVAPRTPAEEVLAGIWSDVLGVPEVGAHDDFFALGGHSLLATRVITRVQQAFGAEIQLRALFETPTVSGLARAVEELRAGSSPLPPVAPVPREGALPLSFAQQRMWFLDQLDPESPAYNIPVAVRMSGPLDAAALSRSLDALVERHEVLRTRLVRTDDGAPAQVIDPPAPLALPTADLRTLAGQELRDEVERRAAEEARRPFDLARDPMLRAGLLRVGDDEHVLLLNVHHVASDGWSMGVMWRDLSALYTAYARGEEPALPPLPVQHADFAVWQRRYVSGERLERQLAYWRERLAGAPPLLELPADRPRTGGIDRTGAVCPVQVGGELTEALRALSRREGATLFMTVLAAFQVLLGRYAAEDDVVVGSPIAGRTRAEVEPLIGCFVNTLALRTDLSGDPTFRQVLARVREGVLGAYEHQELPFEKLVDELQVERNLSHPPLFQVLFTLERADPAGAAPASPELRAQVVPSATGAAKGDLHLNLAEGADGLNGGFVFKTALFDLSTVQRMREHWERLLAAAVRNPEARLSELAVEEDALAFARGDAPGNDAPFVHHAVDLHAERAPGAVAVRCGERTLTFAGLAEASSRLAHHLRSLGVRRESRVGILLPRGPELLVAILGTWKAGGAFVPLDPGAPAERTARLAADAGLAAIVVADDAADPAPGIPCVRPGADRERIAMQPAVRPAGETLPDELAYVIYTSGSTGQPKGVLVEHGSLARYLGWASEVLLDGGALAVAATSRPVFDASLKQLLAPLLTGGAVWLVPDQSLAHPPTLLRELAGAGAFAFNGVPSLWGALLDAIRDGEAPAPAGLRRILLGGESPSPELLAETRELFPGVEIWNLYGPTEATANATAGRLEAGQAVHVGRPAAGARAYVLDRRMAPAPVGAAGELYIGGGGVARGYLGLPGQTAERFVPDPFSGEPGARLYRTGDRVRWLRAGELEFLGRVDRQVKVRGFRIEPGEIEAALLEHAAVRQAAVIVRSDGGQPFLDAFVAGDDVDEAGVRAFLRERLPDYMLPRGIAAIPALPLTPTGKVDRRALAAMDAGPARAGARAPRDVVELRLARIWSELLGGEIGIGDRFFDVGGHSLLAVRLVARVEREFGVPIPVSALFTHPTVEALARVLREEVAGESGSPLVEIRPAGSRPPVFLVHPAGGNVLCYAPLAERLGPDQPVYALQSRGLAPGQPPAGSVEEMAADYLALIRGVQPRGPYRLGGWSTGGVVALEMARLLEAEGDEAVLVALIDSAVPAGAAPADELSLLAGFARHLEVPDEAAGRVRDAVLALEPAKRLRYVWEQARAAEVIPQDLRWEAFERMFRVHEANVAAARRYRPAPVAAPVLLVASETLAARSAGPAHGWGAFLRGEVTIRAVEGGHFSVLRAPAVDAVADALRTALGKVPAE